MKMHFKIIDISYTSSLSSKSICSSYFLHLAWQYGQCQYRRTIKEMMNSPFGMTIEATIEYKVSSKLYLKKWNIDINMKFVVLWNDDFINRRNNDVIVFYWRKAFTFPLRSMDWVCCNNMESISLQYSSLCIFVQTLDMKYLEGNHILKNKSNSLY